MIYCWPLKKSAYACLEEYCAIDFLFAERVLPKGEPPAKQFLAYVMKSAREGHLCVPAEGAEVLPKALFEEVLVREDDRIYLRRNWECENRFLTHLKRLRSANPAIQVNLQGLEKEGLNAEQQEAIRKAAGQTLTLISGGPGTGKTYTASVLIRLFMEGGVKRIFVGAPTGKATANIRAALPKGVSEQCRIETLHSLLKEEQLYADLVLVDEGSMVDAELMAKLYSAVRSGSRLVLLGDKEQLPPVESGHFFSDLAMDIELTAELKTCLRTDLKEIIELANRIKMDMAIPSEPLPDVKSLIKYILDTGKTVLTPLRRGPYGADNLNRLLYQEHQKRGANEVPIMIKVNDPQIGLYNGDTGLLMLDENRAIFKNRTYPEYLLPDYEYAYVLSVHKSQGSEYERVMVILPEGSEAFGKEMLYTAVTRAKKEISLLAHEGVIDKLMKTTSTRFSGLREVVSFFSKQTQG